VDVVHVVVLCPNAVYQQIFFDNGNSLQLYAGIDCFSNKLLYDTISWFGSQSFADVALFRLKGGLRSQLC
jgi:hypothetical protein